MGRSNTENGVLREETIKRITWCSIATLYALEVSIGAILFYFLGDVVIQEFILFLLLQSVWTFLIWNHIFKLSAWWSRLVFQWSIFSEDLIIQQAPVFP